MVTSATFRLPGPLAVAVAQVDEMSGGRVEVGLGTGWFEAEHRAYGIPFPPFGERFDRLEEQLEILTGLWSTPLGESYEFQRPPLRARARARRCRSRVQRPHPPVIVGGLGPRRTPALAARFAAEYNVPFADVETTRGRIEGGARGLPGGRARSRTSSSARTRSPSAARESEAELRAARRADRARRSTTCAATRRGGTPEEVAARLREYRGRGRRAAPTCR